MKIFQKQIRLKPRSRGYHLITDEIESNMLEMKQLHSGIANIFIQHTSAGLTINENADPTVRKDFESFFNRLIPENIALYSHTDEGPDDMTAHIKSSVIGNSITIPITDGKFNLGIWQGIYLCEFRNRSRSRNIVITIFGE
jgi:secondary thiamine-phosphate synthase enzyme